MSVSVSIAREKADIAVLLARAEAGEEITILRCSQAVTCLPPPQPRSRKQKLVIYDLADLRMADNLSLPEDVIDSLYE